jgi:hypothetical protein
MAKEGEVDQHLGAAFDALYLDRLGFARGSDETSDESRHSGFLCGGEHRGGSGDITGFEPRFVARS